MEATRIRFDPEDGVHMTFLLRQLPGIGMVGVQCAHCAEVAI